MGNNDEGKSSKSDKSSPQAPTDQNNIHVYPDWAAMQAYYGPRVTMPPYGHAPPPYMWGPPQPMMTPYGTPYATIYSHGGVYAHPAVPLVSHGHGVPPSPAAATPVETPTKSTGNTERSLMKKLKGFDGLAMSIGNGIAENAEGKAEPRPSQSTEAEGSNDGSDGNTSGTDQSRRKSSREGTPTIGGDGKNEVMSDTIAVGEVTANISPKSSGTVLSPGMTTTLELRIPPTMNAKSSPTSVPCGVMPSEVWLQNEQELKRERRKQSNRESARRSRLRKQAETEELARKVESLTAENATLRSEINQLTEKTQKLRLENATLVEIIMNKKEDKEGEMYKKKSNSAAKLHQLLDASPRADAVVAG